MGKWLKEDRALEGKGEKATKWAGERIFEQIRGIRVTGTLTKSPYQGKAR